jgi:hypothetical protein
MSKDHPACGPTPAKPRVERTIKRDDTTYELMVGQCSCGNPTYKLLRMCGASISVYMISAEDCEQLDEYVSELHESFAVDVEAKLFLLRDMIKEYNSHGSFEAYDLDVFRVRLIDKARLILNRFSKNGMLERILERADDIEDDIVAAFLLGCLATENHWIETHQDAVFEGWSHIEGREAGRPLATAARVRQGKRTRKAVLGAAAEVYRTNPFLQRNDVKTASIIERMKLDSLRKKDGTYLGSEAIVKHLRAARREENPGKSH